MNLCHLAWPAIENLSREIPVVVPIASVEQHGHHLPVYTDSLLLGEVLGRAVEPLHDQVLVTPLQWYGNSHHHLDFAGTLSAPPRTYLDLLDGLLQNLFDHGFKRLLLLNGHGGNEVPGKQAVFEFRQRHRQHNDLLLLYATYWSLGPSPAAANARLHQKEMGHACEWETSMMLCVDRQLVGDYSAAEDVEPGNAFEPASRAWITKDRSTVGHIGAPRLATEAKGELLLTHFSGQLRSLLQRIIAWNGNSWEG